ncbi:MAG: hypothetical protein AB7E83_27140 [Ramlibacter sp.]
MRTGRRSRQRNPIGFVRFEIQILDVEKAQPLRGDGIHDALIDALIPKVKMGQFGEPAEEVEGAAG